MITLGAQGTYELVRSKDHKTILYLDTQGYQRSYVPNIGELLVFSSHVHSTDYVIARGRYRVYTVIKEPDLVDLQHLELSVGNRSWQGYLLLTGLPTKKKIRTKIVPTNEIITGHKYDPVRSAVPVIHK